MNAGDVDLTERGLIEVDRSCIIAELHAHEPCKIDLTILAFIGNKIPSRGKAPEERGDVAISEWRRPRGEHLTYDDRCLAQDYVRGLPGVMREHTTVEP